MMNQMPFNMPNQGFMPMPNFNQENQHLEQRINTLEQKVNNLDNRLKNIENKLNIKGNNNPNNPYDYQSSMYMM